MKLASYIRPFDVKQKIYVLDNKSNTEEIRLSNLEDFDETVMQLMREYNIDCVELHGQKDFCSYVAEKIQSQQITSYGANTVPIIIKTGETI